MRTTRRRVDPEGASPAPPVRTVERLQTLPDLAKFTGLTALLAILSDAAIGHALLWENDPYWTYWVTKTFLIATVFGLGTAWFGTGIGRGAVITAVHTAVLTVYYWSLAPIGTPSSPEWLDLEHTWATGLPVHFGVIYLGYLGALWLWNRRPVVAEATDALGRAAGGALAAGLGIVVVAGALQALLTGEFQGVTWYVTRLLIVVPFLLAWAAVAGTDVRAAIGGSIVLTAILATYSHYLGPVGLPDLPLRIFETEAPGATAHWLSYRQEFLIAMPVTLGTTMIFMVGAAHAAAGRGARARSTPAERSAAMLALALSVAGAAIAAAWVDGAGDSARVRASGNANIEAGDFYSGANTAATGSLSLRAVNRNPRVTPLPPHDVVDLAADVTTDRGAVTVRVDRPIVSDPLGRFTTWWGVGYDVWHHGRSGIGTSKIPATHSDVAVFGLGAVSLNGTVLAIDVPVHVMTMGEQVELDVGMPGSPIEGLTNGHVRAIWPTSEVTKSDAPENARYAYGVLVMIGLLALALASVGAQRRGPRGRGA